MASASTSAPDNRGNTGNLQKSHFQQTVCLEDWWLVRPENDVQGRGLAVAGLTDWGKQGMRVFTSAPILKRYDVFTIETTDGICVVLDGLINKARTLKNGFQSDVLNYFVFGFPPCWKKYEEKSVTKEPLSKDISTDNLPEQLSQELGSKGEQPHVDSHEKDSESQGKTEARSRRKSKKAKSLTVPELPKNEVKASSVLSCGGRIKEQAVIHKNAGYSQVRCSGVTLSACDFNNKSTKKAADNLEKMDCDKRTKTNFDWDMSSSAKTLHHNELRVTTCSVNSLKMKQTNNQRLAGVSDGEKTRLDSISSISSGKVELELVDREPGSRNNLNYRVSDLPRPTNKILFGLPDSATIKLGADQIPETLNQDKDIRENKTRRKIQMAKDKETELPCTPAASTKSCCTPAAVDFQRDTVITGKNILLEKSKARDMDTRRKLAPVSKETPKSEKEKVQSVSPQSFSFNRSRSGRLLMPTLEFWRNQRAIYKVDGTITGIEEGMQPRQGRKDC